MPGSRRVATISALPQNAGSITVADLVKRLRKANQRQDLLALLYLVSIVSAPPSPKPPRSGVRVRLTSLLRFSHLLFCLMLMAATLIYFAKRDSIGDSLTAIVAVLLAGQACLYLFADRDEGPPRLSTIARWAGFALLATSGGFLFWFSGSAFAVPHDAATETAALRTSLRLGVAFYWASLGLTAILELATRRKKTADPWSGGLLLLAGLVVILVASMAR